MRVRQVVLAITGASGAVYGLRLAEELLRASVRLTLLISSPGFAVLKEECGLEWEGEAAAVRENLCRHFGVDAAQLAYYAEDDFFAPIASGSAAPDALVICPCSMGTLARVATGVSGNLLERCADVMLKEHRRLVMVPRETPLSEIHLENMLKLARMGVRMIPAMPAFYHHPRSLDDVVDFVVGRVLDGVGIEHRLVRSWGEESGTGD
ncbi:MAG: aromatic acid decarboxylase [Geobacter sp.]|nr:MAG: aromatic acid decarboxylase [Geobacter sp.]